MTILHTADLHLKKGEDKGLEVLKWLIGKASELNVELFIIAGDLFDSDTDATIMRNEVREIFNATSIRFLLISGNHDAKSFGEDYDYGSNVIQLVKEPFDYIKLDELDICAIPYQNRRFSECITNIPKNIDILIAHGTLYDSSFIFSMLDDEETAYMPIYPANLENIARYVAMGHLHSSSIEAKYKNTHVIYPGSPLALDTKCVNDRSAYFLRIDRSQLKIEKLRVEISSYWIEKYFFIFPEIEERILSEIESNLEEMSDKNIMPHIIIKGFVGKTDKEFKKQIDEINNRYSKHFKDFRIDRDVQSWDDIIQNRMIRNFVEKTKGLDDALRMKVFEITFPIFNKILK